MEKTCGNCWWSRCNGDNCIPFKAGECVDGHVQPKSTLAYIMWKPKDVVFGPEHVGCEVTVFSIDEGCRSATITKYNPKRSECPIQAEYEDGEYDLFSKKGVNGCEGNIRTLFFGKDIEVNLVATGEVVPIEKLICPVCGVEHKIIDTFSTDYACYSFKVSNDNCPMSLSRFDNEEQAKIAMRNLIKAMS